MVSIVLPPFSFVFNSRLLKTACTNVVTVCWLGTQGRCDAGVMFLLLDKTSNYTAKCIV